MDGDSQPSFQKIVAHLAHSSFHVGAGFDLEWLRLLKYTDLQNLHGDHHRELNGWGAVSREYVNVECP